MAATYLKKASKTAESSDDTTRPIVKEMLDKIEAVTRVYALDLDGWDGDIVVLEGLSATWRRSRSASPAWRGMS